MFECVINISEGRDLEVLQRLSTAAGTSLRDRHSDVFHHRSVFTLVNDAADLERDVRALIDAALASLSLEGHEGVHPRLGVVDVVPFVALDPAHAAEAVALRDRSAEWIAATHHLPVFLYGPVEGSERTLPYVRAHAFSDLAPDLGPSRPDPRRGAVVVGARDVLVAWNLWLTGVSLETARDLARLVRGPGVRALGLRVGDRVQVSCNLFDVRRARPSLVYDLVAEHLPRTGAIERAELVGLLPEKLLREEDPGRWAQLGLGEAVTIESRLVAR
ncbi:MAG: hypothetical protein KGL23_00595 [Acidobacteriota bacterium]|nr:hypothetical protein [Acidobacteriota bacterium]MDE3093656.1 hypothetical protein [Acidobacteriota bacterium]MDE3145918.1 hypothetical protein [Acidobacteriota bacterium]